MDCRVVSTARGDVPVWGRFDTFRPERPALLVIRGAFPERDHLFGLVGALPHADVAFVHLPGMHSPYFAESTIPAFGAAFDQVARDAFAGRPVNALGVSMGGLAAYAMTGLRAIVALDTPLTTGGLWPLRKRLQEHARASAEGAEWSWGLFGVGPDTLTLARDYRPLLAKVACPGRVLVGSDPLGEPRPFSRMPSLVSEDDRAAYAAHPTVGMTFVGDAGHNIMAANTGGALSVIRRCLPEAVEA